MGTYTESGIPPLIIVRGPEFYVCGADGSPNQWLKPKLSKRQGSFVFYDPNGRLLKRYGRTFSDNGYGVKVLNLKNIRMSTRYNPVAYISDDKSAAKFAAALTGSTKGMGRPGNINFIARETMLLTALFSFLRDEAPDYELNIHTISEMLGAMARNNEYSYPGCKTAVDILFEHKEAADPESLAVRKYNTFKEITGDFSIRRVVKSCAARIAPLDTEEMRNFFSGDELALGDLYFCETAMFVIPGDPDAAAGFLAPLMYAQLLDLLCEKSVR